MKVTINSEKRLYFLIISIIIILGLLSRLFKDDLPDFIGNYLGDYLWGMMIFYIVRFIFIKFTIRISGFIAIIFSFFIEFSQLYHSEWIDKIRFTIIGGLILGYTFLWSDLFCYLGGILSGMGLDKFKELLFKNIKNS